MLLHEYYTLKREQLSEFTEDAAYDIKILICHALGMSESTFFTNMHLQLTDEQTEATDELINRRILGEPLQYILGEWSFMGYSFYVSPDCLIPRQDTETLAELAISEVLRHSYNTVLDMCTGSGCIGISIAAKTAAKVTLSDISEAALEIAKKNAERNNVDADIIKSDLFESIEGTFDMICINPPYLSEEEMNSLQRELTFEPSLALYGGTDGLDFYRRISESYQKYLNDGGILLMEIGYSQSEEVSKMLPGCTQISDMCGKKRVVAVRKL